MCSMEGDTVMAAGARRAPGPPCTWLDLVGLSPKEKNCSKMEYGTQASVEAQGDAIGKKGGAG